MLETLREGAEFTLYRGRQHGNPVPLLAVAPAAELPSPQSLRRLEHEYLLAADLDPAWAARPLALTRHEGRAVLILKDPIQELAAGIREDEHRPPVATSDLHGPGCPRGIEVGCERVFVFDPPETLRRGLLRGECQRQER